MVLGQNLVSARKAAGLTLDELSARTNIRTSLLKEFEANNFFNAGGDTYARGHLRTLARIYGIPAEVFIDQFDSEHAQEARAIHTQLVENNATSAIPEKSKYTYKQVLTTSIVGILFLIFASFIYSNLKETASSPKPSVKPSASTDVKESASPSPTPSEIKSTYSSGTGVNVKLEALNGSSWLFVSDKNGITLYSGRATQGQIFEFSSTEEVNLRIGNAGAVQLTVNGKKVEPLGGNGEVVNVSYGVNS